MNGFGTNVTAVCRFSAHAGCFTSASLCQSVLLHLLSLPLIPSSSYLRRHDKCASYPHHHPRHSIRAVASRTATVRQFQQRRGDSAGSRWLRVGGTSIVWRDESVPCYLFMVVGAHYVSHMSFLEVSVGCILRQFFLHVVCVD